jgi:hypothetical protein
MRFERGALQAATGGSCIKFRGEAPRTPDRWRFIYRAIRNSSGMDRGS